MDWDGHEHSNSSTFSRSKRVYPAGRDSTPSSVSSPKNESSSGRSALATESPPPTTNVFRAPLPRPVGAATAAATKQARVHSNPTQDGPKTAPKQSSHAQGVLHHGVPRTDADGGMNDDKAMKELKRYKQRAEEWAHLDYIPDEDLESFSEETLKLAGEMLHSDPDRFAHLTEEDLPLKDDNTAKEVARGIKEMTFDEFIQKKQASLETNNPHQVPDPVLRPPGLDQELDEEDEPQEAPPKMRNVIRIPDPEDLLNLPGVGTLKPQLPPEHERVFSAQGMIRDDCPGQLLRDPSLLQLPCVRNLEVFLNKYRLKRDRQAYSEKDLEQDFVVSIQAKVQSCFSKTLGQSKLQFVFFLERPLFVYCVFARRQDLERYKLKPHEKEVPRDRRKYSWAGHRYIMGRDGADDPEPPSSLPPSNFQTPVKASPIKMTSKASSSSSLTDGWE